MFTSVTKNNKTKKQTKNADNIYDFSGENGNRKWRPVSFFDLGNKFVCGELSFDDKDELFDGVFTTVYVQQTAHYHRQSRWIHLHNGHTLTNIHCVRKKRGHSFICMNLTDVDTKKSY